MKGADNCKRLSSQFIARLVLLFPADFFTLNILRFFALYPELAEQSIDAMLDLCEDGNVDIRKQVGGGGGITVIVMLTMFRPLKICPPCVETSIARTCPRLWMC